MTDPRDETQAEYWNGPGGRHWINRQQAWDVTLQPVALAAIDRAALQAGERIVDVGCGCGATTLMLAERVGRTGHVLGLDVSAPMLARAAERVQPGQSIELALADATTYRFAEASYDMLFSRFGVMFFAEPIRAFANLRSALRAGGRLAFACFRAAKDNLWMQVPLQAAYAHVPPLPKAGPEDPGPFSLASEERLLRILGSAGFTGIGLEPLDLELDLASGGGLEMAVESLLEIGPTSRAIDGATPEVRDTVAVSLRQALAPYCEGSAVRLTAAIWLVTAQT